MNEQDKQIVDEAIKMLASKDGGLENENKRKEVSSAIYEKLEKHPEICDLEGFMFVWGYFQGAKNENN